MLPSLLKLTALAPPPPLPLPPKARAKLATPPPESAILAPPLPPPPPIDCARIPYDLAPVVVMELAFHTEPLLVFSAVTMPPVPPEPPVPPILKAAEYVSL
jgi:hypothetical protein